MVPTLSFFPNLQQYVEKPPTIFLPDIPEFWVATRSLKILWYLGELSSPKTDLEMNFLNLEIKVLGILNGNF